METSPLGLTEPYIRLFAAILALWLKDARPDQYERQALARFLEISQDRVENILTRDLEPLRRFAYRD